MRVKVKGWQGERDMNLADYLAPQGYHGYGQGELEDMKSDIRALSEAFGRLLEHMVVDRHSLTIEDACSIAGKTDDVTFAQEE